MVSQHIANIFLGDRLFFIADRQADVFAKAKLSSSNVLKQTIHKMMGSLLSLLTEVCVNGYTHVRFFYSSHVF